MSYADYETAAQLVSEHPDLARFGGERPESLAEQAEAALGVRLPPSYRSFVHKFGAGHIAGEEFYGLTTDNFESASVPNGIWLTLSEREDSNLPEPLVIVYQDGEGNYYCIDTSQLSSGEEHPVVVWVPGASEPDDELDVVADDFGQLFLERVNEGLTRRDATSS